MSDAHRDIAYIRNQFRMKSHYVALAEEGGDAVAVHLERVGHWRLNCNRCGLLCQSTHGRRSHGQFATFSCGTRQLSNGRQVSFFYPQKIGELSQAASKKTDAHRALRQLSMDGEIKL